LRLFLPPSRSGVIFWADDDAGWEEKGDLARSESRLGTAPMEGSFREFIEGSFRSDI
jgi:hypothetical protein